jgi:hypothetical protein
MTQDRKDGEEAVEEFLNSFSPLLRVVEEQEHLLRELMKDDPPGKPPYQTTITKD